MEFVCIIVGAVCLGIFLIVFCRHPQFHPHLIVIVSNFYISYVVMTVTRMAILINYLYNGLVGYELSTEWCQYCDVLRTVGECAALLTCPTLVLERLIATRMLTTYENYRFYTLPFLGLALIWIAPAISVYMIITRGYDIAYFIPVSEVAIVFSAVVFWKLTQWTSLQYTLYIRLYTLSERYQMSENIRFSKILLPALKTFLTGTFVATIIFTLAQKVDYFKSNNLLIFILYHIYEILIALISTALAVICIGSLELWRKEFKKLIMLDNWRRCKSSTNVRPLGSMVRPASAPRVFSLAGDSILIDLRQHGEHYFHGLQSAWK